jgi:hypothetical protein
MPDGNVIQIRVQGRVVDPSGRGQAGVAVGVAAERTSGDEAAGVVLESAVTDEHGVSASPFRRSLSPTSRTRCPASTSSCGPPALVPPTGPLVRRHG